MTRIKNVHQVLEGATAGNAIYNHALLLRTGLRRWGFRSHLFAAEMDASVAGEVLPFDRYRPGRRDLLIYHYSTGSDLSEAVQTMDVPLVLVYHNVTPPEYLRGLGGAMSARVRRGRERLPQLRHRVSLALADSAYNQRDLVAAGYERTGVLPLAVSDDLIGAPPDEALLARFDDGWTNLLFVGRLAPNKRQEDVIKAFYFYRQLNQKSRLFLVGSWRSTRRYAAWLRQFARHLDLADVVFLPGRVSTTALAAYYRLADLFVCMSEHEGFCVPLIESMRFGVPVVAYASTAIPATLGGAGVLVKAKRYDVIAEILHLLCTDAAFRRKIITGQHQRARAFDEQVVLEQFRDHLTGLLGRI
jgi:glycosyltransferase involved in cell wall biosynthesis